MSEKCSANELTMASDDYFVALLAGWKLPSDALGMALS